MQSSVVSMARWILCVVLAVPAMLKGVSWLTGSSAGASLPNLAVPAEALGVIAFIEVVLAIMIASRCWWFGSWACLWFSLGLHAFTALSVFVGVDIRSCGCFGDVMVGLMPHLTWTTSMLLLSACILWSAPMRREPGNQVDGGPAAAATFDGGAS
jgi:hypothetical protein